MSKNIQIPESAFSRFVFSDTRFAWFWLLVRVYVGWQWLQAGWEKVHDAAWVGPQAGSMLKGFLMAALQKTTGAHPDVSGWYGWLIQHVALNHLSLVSHAVACTELAVGIALVVGVFTGIAAFLGFFMNANYLFAGTVSINPPLLILGAFLMLAWRIAGWWGVDRYLLPALGTP